MSRHCSNVAERTAKATGISRRTVQRVHAKFIGGNGHFFTPVKLYSVSRIRINPDSFDRDVIRRVVHGFYERKEYISNCFWCAGKG